MDSQKLTFAFGLILLRLFVICQALDGNDKNPIVEISSGKLLGGIDLSRDGRIYFQFLGIPYGKFDKRFQTSKPADDWPEIRDSSRAGPICYQKTFHTQELVGQEDCLNLNVFTTSLPKRSGKPTKKPVMVFIHGGGFFAGSGIMYSPNYLMDEDIIVVTVNYRLGAFGFLDMGIKEAPGNQGAKDVVLALKWIQDNIGVFNGDPARVTIFGESAGGAIVSNLIYSPMSQGLFVGAIAQSGTGTAPFSTNPRPKYYAMLIASKLGCAVEPLNPKEIISCLQNSPKNDILNALIQFCSDWDNEAECAEMQFNFSVEEKIEGEEPFLPAPPLELISNGKFSKVPTIVGVNTFEAYYWSLSTLSDEKKIHQLNTEWNRVAPILFHYYNYGQKSANYSAKNPTRDKLSQHVRQFYFDNAPIQNNPATIDAIEKGFGDNFFKYPARRLAQLLSAQNVDTYLYSFDKRMDGKPIGESPVHAEELNYLFKVAPPDGSPPIGANSSDYNFSKNMIKLWISFAANGKPTHTWGDNSEAWKAFVPDATNYEWFHIDDDIVHGRQETGEFRDRMNFWQKAEANTVKVKTGTRNEL